MRTIDCEDASRRLFEFLDTELRGKPQQEIEQHLARCRECFSRFEFERRLKGHVADLGTEPLPVELQQRIRKVLDGFTC